MTLYERDAQFGRPPAAAGGRHLRLYEKHLINLRYAVK